MALRGWSVANNLRMASVPVSAAPLTVAAWARTSVTGAFQVVCGLGNSASAINRNAFKIYIGNTNLINAEACSSSSATSAASSAGITANTWFHACAVYTSTTARAAFLNGANKGTSGTSIGAPSGPNQVMVGMYAGSNNDNPLAGGGTGDIAEFAIWNVALTDAEVARLAAGLSPMLIRPQNLVHYSPIRGRASPELNIKSNTDRLAVQGTLTFSAHPRIIMPRRRKLVA